MDEKRPINPLDGLRGVVDDLWGSTMRLSAENAAQLAALTRDLEAAGAAVELPADVQPIPEKAKPAPAPADPAAPIFPAFDRLWKTADESVDWTDALAHAHPTDPLTSEALWGFFHEHAEAVLAGRIPAYLEVLKTANPLGDLTSYARSFNVRAQSADLLSVRVEALPAYLAKQPEEVRRYLAGLSLRCARDLMALLPVCEVRVEVAFDGDVLFAVPFTRAELKKVRFTLVEPALFALACGGAFADSLPEVRV